MHVCPLPRKASINRRRAYRPDITVYVELFSGRDYEASEGCQKLVMDRDVWSGGEIPTCPRKNSRGVQHQVRRQPKFWNIILLLQGFEQMSG